MGQRAIVLSLLFTTLAGCAEKSDFSKSREAVKNELRDPASAEFRKEAVRTLWTANGMRITVYCAEVNSNNAFGGKTGFRPVEHVVSTRIPPNGIYKPGAVWLYDKVDAGYYLDCVRADTQRNPKDFGSVIPTFGAPLNTLEWDTAEPVLSNSPAPAD